MYCNRSIKKQKMETQVHRSDMLDGYQCQYSPRQANQVPAMTWPIHIHLQLHCQCHCPWPNVTLHKVWYTDLKLGKERALLLDRYLVSELRYQNQYRKRKSWIGASLQLTPLIKMHCVYPGIRKKTQNMLNGFPTL